MTLFTGAKSLPNSRSLIYQTSNPEDETPLTPNHFLHGQVEGQFAPATVDETRFNLCDGKDRRRVQELVRHFWQRCLRELLPYIGKRTKYVTRNTLQKMTIT